MYCNKYKYNKLDVVGSMKIDMAIYKKITITLHPIEVKKLKEIAEKNKETISGMVSRLIKDY